MLSNLSTIFNSSVSEVPIQAPHILPIPPIQAMNVDCMTHVDFTPIMEIKFGPVMDITLPSLEIDKTSKINMDTWKTSSHLHFQPEVGPQFKQIHCQNAQELARRVKHKYLKWGSRRFGSTPETQLDFYDGSPKLKYSKLEFTEAFDYHLKMQTGDWYEIIKANLHLGQTSAHRFQPYIKVVY